MNSHPTASMNVLPKHLELFYGGRWHAPVDGAALPTINPANGETLAKVAHAGVQDTLLAVQAARDAFPSWSAMPGQERANLLREAAAILRLHATELAMIDAYNTGNPVAEMVRDANIAASGIEFFAGLVSQIKGETLPMGEGMLNYPRREPLGVVARIVAYNHPLMFAAMKIGAPLAAGNCRGLVQCMGFASPAFS